MTERSEGMTDDAAPAVPSPDSDEAGGEELAGAPGAPARSFWWITALTATTVVVLDQLTKHWAVNRLADGEVIDVVWTLRFQLSFNSGMAFGKGTGFGPIIGVIALVVIVGLLLTLRHSGSRVSALAVGLVVGGAIGNVLDRLLRAGDGGFLHGRVVDFIDAQWWPVFNVADMGITIGGLLLVAGSFLAPRRPA
jgi:signal peptidase II